jgi:hypothetical protein
MMSAVETLDMILGCLVMRSPKALCSLDATVGGASATTGRPDS